MVLQGLHTYLLLVSFWFGAAFSWCWGLLCRSVWLIIEGNEQAGGDATATVTAWVAVFGWLCLIWPTQKRIRIWLIDVLGNWKSKVSMLGTGNFNWVKNIIHPKKDLKLLTPVAGSLHLLAGMEVVNFSPLDPNVETRWCWQWNSWELWTQQKEVSVFLGRERFSKCDSSFFRCFFTHRWFNQPTKLSS